MPTVALLEVYKYVVRARNREGALQVVANMRQGSVAGFEDLEGVEYRPTGSAL